MNDYQDLGYDQYLRRINPIFTQNTNVIYEDINSSRRYEIRAGKVQTEVRDNGFIDLSGTATTSGTVAAGSIAIITTTLDPVNSAGSATTPISPEYLNFAIPYVAVFEGTAPVGSMQIFPFYGNGPTKNQFNIHAGFDMRSTPGGTYTGINSLYRIMVYNTGGTTANLYFESQWKFTDHGVSNG